MTVSFDTGCYGVRLAATDADVAACQALRHQAFFGRPGWDADAFDPACEHLMIAGHTGLVATCRVMLLPNGAALQDSYAAERYDLTNLSGFTGPMMELGRFCTRPGVQGHDVLRLAWGALAQIVDRNGVAFMFGCASFAGTSATPHAEAFAFLAAHASAPKAWAPQVRSPDTVPLTRDPAAVPRAAALPPLLRSYLSLGGWVSDHAVVDRQLNTLHVFTGLEVARIPPRRAAALRAVADVGASGGDI